jgi:hypothetical protein
VQWSIHDEWLKWMKEEHIPEVLATGFFTKHLMVKLLEVDETEGATYAVQYFAESKDEFDQYIDKESARLRKAGIDKWGQHFIAFRTLMQVVN